jgi:hypothetical protein
MFATSPRLQKEKSSPAPSVWSSSPSPSFPTPLPPARSSSPSLSARSSSSAAAHNRVATHLAAQSLTIVAPPSLCSHQEESHGLLSPSHLAAPPSVDARAAMAPSLLLPSYCWPQPATARSRRSWPQPEPNQPLPPSSAFFRLGSQASPPRCIDPEKKGMDRNRSSLLCSLCINARHIDLLYGLS